MKYHIKEHSLEWLFYEWIDAKKWYPIPTKFLSFHKSLTLLGVYSHFQKLSFYKGVDLDDQMFESFSPDIGFYALVMNNDYSEFKMLFETFAFHEMDAEGTLLTSFLIACRKNYFELAKYCYQQFKETIGSSIHEAFIMQEIGSLISKNRFEFAKYLYQLVPDEDIIIANFKNCDDKMHKLPKKIRRFKEY